MRSCFDSLEVRLTKSAIQGVIAYGSITIDRAFAVNITVRPGRNGVFVCFPSHKCKDGSYKDDAFPVTREAREEINECVTRELKRKGM